MSHAHALKVLVSTLVVVSSSLLAGCALSPEDGDDAAPLDDAAVGEAEQALTCADASCTGINPYNTNCVLDQQAKGSGAITSQTGGKIGTVTIYYSPTCHAIWGSMSFTAAHGSSQICATNVTNVSQPPQCTSYGSGTYSAVSNMQFLRVNDTGYSTVFVASPTLGSGGTPTFRRTF